MRRSRRIFFPRTVSCNCTTGDALDYRSWRLARVKYAMSYCNSSPRGPISISDAGVAIYEESARGRSMKRLRILALMHEDCVPPANAEAVRGERVPLWKTEHDVLVTLAQL